ncbi:MAG: anti-sigma factor domain-containing protein [Blastocatellia bacterium]
MNWEEIKELAPLYAVGALDTQSTQEVDYFLRWTATCEQRREFAEWSDMAAMLPLSLPQSTPSHNLKAELLTRIETQMESAFPQPIKPATSRLIPFRLKQRFALPSQQWLVAALILVTFGGAYLAWQNYKVTRQLTNSDAQFAALRQQFENVLSPNTRIIAMRGMETPNATAKIVWNLEKQTWDVHIHNLPAPSGDKSYQLWYVTKDAKINAAVFSTGESGSHELKLSLPAAAIQGLAATAVTLEPKGGSPQPTGKFYLLAQI